MFCNSRVQDMRHFVTFVCPVDDKQPGQLVARDFTLVTRLICPVRNQVGHLRRNLVAFFCRVPCAAKLFRHPNVPQPICVGARHDAARTTRAGLDKIIRNLHLSRAILFCSYHQIVCRRSGFCSAGHLRKQRRRSSRCGRRCSGL